MLRNCDLTVEQEKEVKQKSPSNSHNHLRYAHQVLEQAIIKGQLKRVAIDKGHSQNEALFKRAAANISLIIE